VNDLDVFVPFSLLHLLAVVVCALLIVALTMAGRAMRARGSEAGLRKSFAVFGLCYWVADIIWWNWNGLDVYGGLPLHLCDFNALVAPFALLTLNRWLRATLYFWSFTLSLQAFIQPVLPDGPAHLEFWAFWLGHTIIMASAVYDLVVLGFRPDWSDFARAVAASLAYVAFVTPINLTLDTDYGFIGNPPPGKSIPPFVDAMGPWPRRAVMVGVLALIGFVVVLLPWRITWRRSAQRAELAQGLEAGETRT
jgi:hypothetical integral membrane protein (TIGR02206 family)